MEKLFYHGTSSDGHRFTLGAVVTENFVMELAISLCSAKDHFQRKVGIISVEERLKELEKGSFSPTLVVKEDAHRVVFLRMAKSFEDMNSRGLKRLFNLDKR